MPSINRMHDFFSRIRRSRTLVLLLVPLALSAFVHLWNPIGFPYFHGDEGHYMRRSVHIVEGLGAQEQRNTTWSFEPPYDHPYFGQILLGSILAMSGYPSSYNFPSSYSPSSMASPNETVFQSVQILHLIPRIIMGVLAIFDTFLVYKIAELRYNRNVALVAAILFAVMPMSWFVRRVVLESLLLPVILLSILFASAPKIQKDGNRNRNKNLPLITSAISGIFLGLAIFTKIPAFTMIPLIAYLVFTNSNTNRLKNLALWFIPVITIPLIWPAYAISVGDFDQWWHDTLLQATREGRGLILSIIATFRIDPVLWMLAFAGAIFTAIRRDYFAVLWIIPFLVFHTVSTIIQHFHWIILLPIFCIASSVLISDLSNMIVRRLNKVNWHVFLSLTTASAIGIFGIVSTIAIITMDVNQTYFQMYTFIVEHLPELQRGKSTITNNEDVTMMGSNWMQVFSWVPEYIFNKEHNFKTFSAKNLPLIDEKVLLLVDSNDLKRYIRSEDTDKTFEQKELYDSTKLIAEFREKKVSYDRDIYPYTSLHENRGIARGAEVEIRSNY